MEERQSRTEQLQQLNEEIVVREQGMRQEMEVQVVLESLLWETAMTHTAGHIEEWQEQASEGIQGLQDALSLSNESHLERCVAPCSVCHFHAHLVVAGICRCPLTWRPSACSKSSTQRD